MKIAVVDVAAQNGGALSVLNDFVDSLIELENGTENEWFIITSIVETRQSENVHNMKFPKIKRSWLYRLWWEYWTFRHLVKELEIDVVFSLQNNGLPVPDLKQVVYFHNVLLVQNSCKFSFWVKTERIFAVYSKILGPYIRYSWKYANAIIVQGNSVKEQVGRYFPENQIYVCRSNVTAKSRGRTTGRVKGFIYPATALVYKNFELIVEAVKKLEEAGEEFEVIFTIVGDENLYAERIKDESAKTKSIKLIGYQSRQFVMEKYNEYGLIITSKLESFAVPILEAMNCQTVIVALDMPYVWDHTQSTQYNRLHIAQNNIESLAVTMKEALRDDMQGCYTVDKEEGMHHLINIIREVGENSGIPY